MPPRFQFPADDVAERPASPAATTKPLISAVVVNYRHREHSMALARQLDSSDAMRGGLAEILIVDNDDDPKPLRQWASSRPGLRLHSFGRNRGFARAVNEGCRRAKGEWLLLLNPDISVPEEFIDKALAAAERLTEQDPRVGVVGFELRHADDTLQPSTGPFPTLANVVGGLLRRRKHRRCRPRTEAAEVPWATGCCMLVRRPCWQELGGFDEDFFLYYEDVDLCRRARESGWSVWYEPAVKVQHFFPLHSRAVPPALRVVTRHALLTYAAKHWPSRQFKALSRLVAAEAAVRGFIARRLGRPEAATHYQRLGCLVRELMVARAVRARHWLLRSLEPAAACEP